MKPISEIQVTPVIHSETTQIGDDISPLTAPVFKELGLGDAGDLPAPAYEHMQPLFVAKVIGAYLVHGDARTAVRDAWRIECVALPENVAARIGRLIDQARYPGVQGAGATDQTVYAIVDTVTKQPIIYMRVIFGDAPADYFHLA